MTGMSQRESHSASIGDPPNPLGKVALFLFVQPRCRFVEQEQLGFGSEGAAVFGNGQFKPGLCFVQGRLIRGQACAGGQWAD